MPRFVVLEHDHPVLHWDLMLEAEETLRTWRLAERPRVGRSTTTEVLPDHRTSYLDYEGPVSGGRGTVRRVMAGEYSVVDESPDSLRVRLRGENFEAELEIAPPNGCGVARFLSVDGA